MNIWVKILLIISNAVKKGFSKTSTSKGERKGELGEFNDTNQILLSLIAHEIFHVFLI